MSYQVNNMASPFMLLFFFCIIMWNTCNERDNLLRASLREPGLPICTNIWFTTRLTRVSLSTDENLKIGAIKDAKNLQNPVWRNGGVL